MHNGNCDLHKSVIEKKKKQFSYSNNDQLILSKHQTNQIDFGQNENVTGNRAIVVRAYEEALRMAMEDTVRKHNATNQYKLSLMIIGPGCSELLPIVMATSKKLSQKLSIFIYDGDERVIHKMARGIEHFYPQSGNVAHTVI